MSSYSKSGIKSHLWTADEIKKLARLWTSRTIDEMAKELHVHPSQVVYMGSQVRLEFPDLVPKKHRKGFIRNLIKEALG